MSEPNNCGCAEFSRGAVLRNAAAQAGRGLPAVEAGMPLPAGTGLSRRSFLSRAAGGALAVYGASKLPLGALEEGIAAAAESGDRRVLVSVFLSGGADSLSLLAPDPAAHPDYARLRPTLALPSGSGTPFGEDSSLRWHPSAAGFATLHAEGKVSVLPAIGYDDPNQSHFTSRHYWEVGETNPAGRVGWLGRFLDREGVPDNPLQGLTLGWDLSPALASADVPVAAVSRPDEYDFWAPGVWGPIEAPMLDALGALGQPATSDAELLRARQAAARSARLRKDLQPFEAGFASPAGVTYPTGSEFARRLAALAAMLDSPLPLRAVALEGEGGYDTHSDQQNSLPRNMKLTADGLLAFQRDLEARGLADRVLVHVWSEFGRRPQENGSGTDHGAGGLSLVIGSRAKGQMVGEFPGLATLDRHGNLRSTSDFRALYCSLLEQWYGVDAGGIVPGASSHARYSLLKSSA